MTNNFYYNFEIMGKYRISVNDVENIRELLQETYNTADSQLKQSQDEITKLSNSTRLIDEPMDSKSKYMKAISDLLTIKDKAISKKIEIAKLLTEIYKHNGDVNATLDDTTSISNIGLDFKKIRELVNTNGNDDKETIKLNNKRIE